MDVLVAGEGIKFLDACLDVVAGQTFTLANRVEIDLVDDALVAREGFLWNSEAERALGPHNADPVFALQANASLERPNLFEGLAGIARGQDVGDGRRLSGHGGNGEFRIENGE